MKGNLMQYMLQRLIRSAKKQLEYQLNIDKK